MKNSSVETFSIKVYISGPIEVAKQILREECMGEGLCVTIDPTTFIYTGGEERGYVVGLLNYPRFPTNPASLLDRARKIAVALRDRTCQDSYLILGPCLTEWESRR